MQLKLENFSCVNPESKEDSSCETEGKDINTGNDKSRDRRQMLTRKTSFHFPVRFHTL